MADVIKLNINANEAFIRLRNFTKRMNAGPLMKIAGAVMKGSIETTFREQGSPAGSWAPLAKSTLKRGKRKGKRQILIQSSRLKNSITYVATGNRLVIGTNVKYAAIHQLGGVAGRRGPFKKRNGRRPFIPARPYLVFRPEDPARIQEAMETYIAQATKEEGLD
jgi:phage virion morphogenesis protein